MSKGGPTIIDYENPFLRPQDINPEIPNKFQSYRASQRRGIKHVMDALPRARVVFLDMQTGAGKSLCAESVRSLYNPDGQTLYLATTHILQEQQKRDFPYAEILKGRDNYPTRNYPNMYPTINCGGCEASRKDRLCNLCTIVGLCPYAIAKQNALDADLTVTNTAYFLREVNGPRLFSGRRLVIVDEADSFEDTILSTFSVVVPRWMRTERPAPLPATLTSQEHINQWRIDMIEYAEEWKDILPTKRELWEPKQVRSRGNAVDALVKNLRLADDTWIYSGPSGRSRKEYETIELRPKWIGDWAEEHVWRHAEKWLLMSASFVSMELTAHTLGLEPEECAFVKVDYSFPKERRPVYYWPSKPYTRKAERDGFQSVDDMTAKIATIIDWYPTERIIIHTQSHKRTRDVVNALKQLKLKRRLFYYTSVSSKAGQIEAYLVTPNSILVGAGLERGYDFPYEDCRVNIIVKTPFADLSDPIIDARLHEGTSQQRSLGQAAYNLATSRATVQMVGRAMRAEDDFAVSYLLDGSFEPYLTGSLRRLMPGEFLAALKFGTPTKGVEIQR